MPPLLAADARCSTQSRCRSPTYRSTTPSAEPDEELVPVVDDELPAVDDDVDADVDELVDVVVLLDDSGRDAGNREERHRRVRDGEGAMSCRPSRTGSGSRSRHR